MDGTLTGLFVISALLLMFSILKSTRTAKIERNHIDEIHISLMKEINAVQESVRNTELDIEVAMGENGIHLTSDEKIFRRGVLDLFKRNYSMESIAETYNVSKTEIEQLLAPYQIVRDEGRKVANEN
ncbi:MAG: hypothetical protein Q8906_10650 [Bacillota bacterium]|nr:hypothetical protein [Bacillota bacterium]